MTSMPNGVVEYIVKSMVDKPDQVRITQKNENSKVLLLIHVDEGDLGKVIGKDGKTIKAIRSLISLITNDRNLFVDINNN